MSDSPETALPDLYASRIEDYAILADGETAALLSRSGSIDWLCWPTFASGATFAALLGTADHGFWKIGPRDGQVGNRIYRGNTMIVETTFETPTGAVLLVDFMPPCSTSNSSPTPSSIVRIVRCLHGSVDLQSNIAMRFDYGRTVPWVTREKAQSDWGTGAIDTLHAVAGSDAIIFRSASSAGALPNHGANSDRGMSTITDFTLTEGQSAWFTLTHTSFFADGPAPLDVEGELTRTEKFWRDWSNQSTYKGPYAEAVQRSLLTLKALTYNPSGGIVAAPTASLPEFIGGERNWDYRFCWLRDASFTLLVLLHAGFQEEAVAWRLWLLRAIAGSPDQIQTIYGICGERQLLEWSAPWLPGYEHSAPVNFGNAAVDQFQLDVFGELASVLFRMPNVPEGQRDTRISAAALQTQLTNHVCDVWRQPDDGIWETRGGRKHFTYSKVSAWVALDRAIRLVETGGDGEFPDADVARWRKVRDEVHADVCQNGFSPSLNAFTQSYGSNELDASCLRIALVGFLPIEDPRMVGTIEAIQKTLTRDGFVMRYNTDSGSDGLPPGEGAFLACSFWLVTCLALLGRKDEATTLFECLLSLANDVGLLSEEWDPKAKRMLGNFPQALSHISLCHAAFTLAGEWKPVR